MGSMIRHGILETKTLCSATTRPDIGRDFMAMPTVKDLVVDLPAVLRVDHLQLALGLSKAKAYELVHQQGFPVVRFGRAIRIPRDAFLQWLESQARG
jgi:excisionase family DNA binding protein